MEKRAEGRGQMLDGIIEGLSAATGEGHSREGLLLTGLAFHGILATGSRELGDAKGPGGEGVFDLFLDPFDLPNHLDGPCLLLLATKRADFDKNFITINASPEVTSQSFAAVEDQAHFVWRILPNPSDTWVLQVHQISSGKLKSSGNVLGIHTRNEHGEQARVRDSFGVARIFLVYPTAGQMR